MEKSNIDHEVEKLRRELAAVDMPSVEPEHPSVPEDPEGNRHDDSPLEAGPGEPMATTRGGMNMHPTVAVALFALGFLTGRLITRRR